MKRSGQHAINPRALGLIAASVMCQALLAIAPALGQSPWLMQVDLPSARIEGMPVHWDDATAVILARDGQMHLFDVAEIRHQRLQRTLYQPETLNEARVRLQQELGEHFETLVAGPYVVATPIGESARWRDRLNALLAGYTRYFEVRGWPLIRPDFPLVVVVYSDREQFLSRAQQAGSSLPQQAVGCFLPRTNRCLLYQIPGGRGVNWAETEATIVHEAVHQLAYNTGVHERLFENPSWFVEGLATMFEQPAVYDLGVSRSSLEHRIHPEHARHLQPLLKDSQQLNQVITGLVRDDEIFQLDTATAYAVSWAMTFYLAERMPNEYRRFFELQKKRHFGAYTADQRQRDFEQAFSIDTPLLAIQIARLLSQP